MFTLEDIKAAQKRIAPIHTAYPASAHSRHGTPCWAARFILRRKTFNIPMLSSCAASTNRMLQLTPEERARGIVCLSSGNHAQGVACAAHRLGLDAVIVMPTNVNPAKLAGVRLFSDVKVELVGTEDHERAARADELVPHRRPRYDPSIHGRCC